MAVTVDIDGGRVEISDVATEKTLERLVNLMEKSATGKTPAAVAEVKARAANTKELTTGVVKLKGLASAGSDATDALEDAAKSANTFAARGKKMLDAVLGAGKGLINFGGEVAGTGLNMKSLGDAVDKNASQFGALGAVFGAAAGAIVGHSANLIDTFDGLSSTGATFTNNLFDLERVAANSYLSLEQMTGMLRENSESLAVFGGSARLGAKRFSEMNRVVQDTYRTDFAMMGIKASESAEMLAQFTAMQARNTQFATLGVQQQAQAGANFVKEVQMMANLTGQDRKQLAQKMANDKRRADVELQMSRMQGEAASGARAAFATMGTQFGEGSPIMDALRTSFLGLPAAATTAGNMLLQDGNMGPVIARITAGLKDGTVSMTDIQKELAGVSTTFIEANKGMEGIAQYSEIAMAFTEVSAALLNAQKQRLTVEKDFNGDYDKFVAAQKTQLDENSKNMKNVDLLSQEIGKTVRLGFNSVTESAVSVMSAGVKSLQTLVTSMPTSMDAFTNAIGDASKPASAVGAAKGLQTGLEKAAGQLKMFKDALEKIGIGGGTASATTATSTNIAEGVIKGAQSSDEVAKAAGQSTTMLSKASGMLGKILPRIPIIGSALSGGVTYATSEQETQVGKISEGIGSGLGSFGGAAGGAATGALIGSAVPIIGTLIGGIIGGIAGGIGGDMLGKSVGGKLANFFGFAEGGIVTQPIYNAAIGEKPGTQEGVFPLPANFDKDTAFDRSGEKAMAQAAQQIAKAVTNFDNSEMLQEMRKFNKNIKVVGDRLA